MRFCLSVRWWHYKDLYIKRLCWTLLHIKISDICVLLGSSRFRGEGWWITRNGAVRYGLCTLARAATRLVGENLHTPLGWVGGIDGVAVVAIPVCGGRDNRFKRYNDMIVQFRSPRFTIVIYESARKTPRALLMSRPCAFRQTQSKATCMGQRRILHYDESGL